MDENNNEGDFFNNKATINVDKYFSLFKKILGGWTGWLLIIVLVALWASQGLYTVDPSEVGLVKRFGKHVRTVGPGLNYHIPAPIESVVIVNISQVRKIEVGYTTISPPPNPKYRINKEEAQMLTGDSNIVHIEFAVQYKVKSPENYVFNIIDPESMIKAMSEAIIREEIAKRKLTDIITVSRDEIAQDVYKDLQVLLDNYQTGILVEAVKLQDANPPEEVKEAFDDVNSAHEDRKTYVNQARSYANKIVPEAEAKAASIINDAEAYKEEKINSAQGDVAKFKDVLAKYNMGNKEITKTRLYIESMEKILPETQKILLTENASGSSVLKLLDINKILANDGGEVE